MARIRGLLVIVLMAGCTSTAAPARLAASAQPAAPLIAVEQLVPERDVRRQYHVSPDGTRLAWLEGQFDRAALHFEILAQARKGVLERYGRERLVGFVWAQDSQHILYVATEGGARHVYLAATDQPEAPPLDLTPSSEAWSRIHRVPKGEADHVILESGHGATDAHDLFRVNLETRASTRITENSQDVTAWLADDRGEVRARLRGTGADGGVLEVPVSGGWRPLQRFDLEEFEAVRLLDVTPDGRGLWLLSGRGRDRLALVRVDTATAVESVVYKHPRVDVAEVTLVASVPLLALTHPDHPALEIFDPARAADLRALLETGPASLHVLSTSDDRRLSSVAVVTDRRVTHWLINHETGERRLLEDSSRRLADSMLAAVEPISFTSRDGIPLHGYLTRPPGLAGPLPLVLLVHGGPRERNIWQADAVVQFLANRGYAVLQVNFRGSTGYGRAFSELAAGEYAAKMHTDVLDGVRWAVVHRIADPTRVAIVGGSYGGYEALVGMTFTPDVFACGVALAPLSNLVTALQTPPAYWTEGDRAVWRKYLGDPARAEDRARMEAKSPLFQAARARGPLLILHGESDTTVRPEQSEVMVAALRGAGKRVSYVVLPYEGHGLENVTSVRHYLAELEDFLAPCLGGRVQGFPDAYDYDGLIQSGWTLLGAGRPRAALERARAAARLNPAEFEAYELGVAAAAWAGDTDSAKSLLKDALERAPSYQRNSLYAWLRKVDPREAEAAFQRRLEAGRAARERGDASGAALEYYEAVRIRPDRAGPGLEAVLLLAASGDYERAHEILVWLVRAPDPDVVKQVRPWLERVEKVRRSVTQAARLVDVGDHAAALTILRDPENQTSGWAMYVLGLIHQSGLGVTKDEAEAARWFRRAAEAGDTRAMAALGSMYREGRGVAPDDVEAVRWLRQAAAAGQAWAMGVLSVMYLEGRGVAPDDVEAVRWLRRAVEGDVAPAMYGLGWMYEMGRGVVKDEAQAVDWYRKAAAAGSDDAMNRLRALGKQP